MGRRRGRFQRRRGFGCRRRLGWQFLPSACLHGSHAGDSLDHGQNLGLDKCLEFGQRELVGRNTGIHGRQVIHAKGEEFWSFHVFWIGQCLDSICDLGSEFIHVEAEFALNLNDGHTTGSRGFDVDNTFDVLDHILNGNSDLVAHGLRLHARVEAQDDGSGELDARDQFLV